MRKNFQRIIDWVTESQNGVDVLFDSTAQLIGMENVYGWFSPQTFPPLDIQRVLYFASSNMVARSFDVATLLIRCTQLKTLFITAQNDAGGKSLAKLVKSFGLEFTSESRAHCQILRIDLSGQKPDKTLLSDALHKGGVIQRDDGLWTKAGVFSWQHTDAGSAFLMAHIPHYKFEGRGADFGCGVGELSRCILSMHQKTHITALDYDSRAVECVQKNLESFVARFDCRRWDVNNPSPVHDLDFIIMNPPFHTGKQTTMDLGLMFIRRARESLKKDGVLLFVANRQLPYEDKCRELFSSVVEIKAEHGFKILECRA